MSVKVTLDQLRKVFIDQKSKREVIAVSEFSLEIASGELVTFLGPSGCGKTTVLRMLGGFEEPSSGKILFDGKDITNLPANQRNSAMVFQSYALFPHMTVAENVAYGLKFRKLSKEERAAKLEKMLELVGLKELGTRRPGELSGGQQQRVALARSLVIEPGLLLFDEPLSNLDAKLREYMRIEIRKLQKKVNITAVYVTHDQSEAMAISDRVVVMNKGAIEQVGTPQEIYLKPATRFVADFMGSANFLTGKLQQGAQGNSLLISVNSKLVRAPSPSTPFDPMKVTLVVRPEHVDFVEPSKDKLTAKVKEYQFLGAYHEYLLEVETGEPLTVRSDVEVGVNPKNVGDTVSLSFPENQLHVLPKQA